MASVNWLKATTQKAGAMKKHNGRTERVKGNHSNVDIDRSKSHLNVYIGADDYAPMFEKVKARIAQVDEEHPPKRNQGDRRITCVFLETPVPQEITEQGKATDFLYDAHRVIEDFFGAENVGGTVGHFDEQHLYIDKDGSEKMSLVHGHTIVAAYAEWTDKKTGELRKGINGKNCETKARLNALNKAMCDMCREKYGVEYNTGKEARRKTVEVLKAETELATVKAARDNATKELANIKADKQKEAVELVNLKQQTDDFVKSLTPTPTKKVKGLLKEKEVEKTPEELERDKQVLAAQAVLKHIDERERSLAIREAEVEQKEQVLATLQRETAENARAVEADRNALEVEKRAFETEKKSFFKAVAIKARQIVDKVLRSLGIRLNRGYDLDKQINLNLQQERSEEQWRQQ